MDDKTKTLSDAELEQVFEASIRHAPEPQGDLFAAILADAEAVAETRTHPAPVPEPVHNTWFGLAEIWRGIGGVPGFAGLAAAMVVGVGVGLNPPDMLASVGTDYFGVSDTYVLDLVPDLEGALVDG